MTPDELEMFKDLLDERQRHTDQRHREVMTELRKLHVKVDSHAIAINTVNTDLKWMRWIAGAVAAFISASVTLLIERFKN